MKIISSKAHYVLLPIWTLLTIPSLFLEISGFAELFCATDKPINCYTPLSKQWGSILSITEVPWNIFNTDIVFFVKVPVLSEQILSTPPIVSQAAKYLTKLFYYFIFPTLKASEMVTARGNPSGTETTIILIAIMKALTTKLTVSIWKNSSINTPLVWAL